VGEGPKALAILGSTGSIGEQALAVAEAFPERYRVVALGAGRNLDKLADQVRRFRPRLVSVAEAAGAEALRGRLGDLTPEIAVGASGLEAVASHPADLVVSGLVGAVGLAPTLAAIRAGRNVALANKEVLVMAGALVLREVRAHGVTLLPVDSEHSAIFQALAGQRREDVARLILTASGGPFRCWDAARIARATVEEALAHPNWEMGPKISIDSATLMNKGLEVIEARWLFDVPPDAVDVVVHPQSIVHSLVEFRDGSVLAQLGSDRRGAGPSGASRPGPAPPGPGRPGAAGLRGAGPEALPLPRPGHRGAPRRRGGARRSERGQRGVGGGIPGGSDRLSSHRRLQRRRARRPRAQPRGRAAARPG
jgi:1-deoxy-D-xylulose-5-phosphate reductoisomerase